jgi:serine/threonine-protein kinase
MSPEQVRSPKTVDHRTDIWSLGICIYELLTNSMPFGGEEVQETFAQILERDPTPIRSLVTGVPEGLEQVVMKCLAKNRDDRYPDVGELAKALTPFGSGTWTQSADRICATLARAAIEGKTSSMRLRGAPLAEGAPIPSSRRPVDHELHGTASTLARRSVLESNKRWLVGVAVAASVAGIGLLGLAYARHTGLFPVSAAAAAADPSASDPPPPTAEPPPPIPTISTASVENDLPSSPIPAATVIGASPLPPPAPSLSGKPKTAPLGTGRLSGPSVHHKKDPAPATSSAKALPAGLPATRSGQ